MRSMEPSIYKHHRFKLPSESERLLNLKPKLIYIYFIFILAQGGGDLLMEHNRPGLTLLVRGDRNYFVCYWHVLLRVGQASAWMDWECANEQRLIIQCTPH